MRQADEFPSFEKTWCRYTVRPIGASLRTEDKDEGYTPDMVIPILPNTHYAKGRAPVRPRPSFPFPNCFHWIECELTVRVARLTSGATYDYSHAIRLSARQDIAMKRKFNPDIHRIADYRCRRYVLPEEGTGPSPPAGQEEDSPQQPGKSYIQPDAPLNVDDICVAPLDPDCNVDDFLEEAPSEAPGLDDWGDLDRLRREVMKFEPLHEGLDNPTKVPNCSDATQVVDTMELRGAAGTPDAEPRPPSTTSSLRDFVLSTDLFGERDHDDPSVQVIPLVRVWLELEEHLTAETIPSPEELFNEADAIEM